MTYFEYLIELFDIVKERYELAAARVDGQDVADVRDALRQKDDALWEKARELYKQKDAVWLLEAFHTLSCSRFERHTVAMLLFWELRPECARANRQLCDYAHMSPYLLGLTYEGEYADDEAYLSLSSDSVFASVFLDGQNGRGMDRPLTLSPRVLRKILTGQTAEAAGEAVFRAKAIAEEGSPIPRAQRIDCRFFLSDVVLPKESIEAIRLCCQRVKNAAKVYGEWGMGRLVTYGKGVSLLFAGPPGTGKTMTAQAVANELSMDLYRVNLPAVVSKYVGETEQHLNEIFEHARGRNVVLFFDEADVLFGKRTEIKDANDKYANMEAAFLLQRIEEYEGVTILATNYRQNFDEAFNRRLTATITFPFPDEESRLSIWQRSIPKQLASAELQPEKLARHFELSGSSIKNVVLYAAFLAAAEGKKSLSMDLILEGIREEYKKQGKIMALEELRNAISTTGK